MRIVWAMKDIAFTPQMLEQAWQKTFPDAEVTRIDDAGHYLQEDAHERIVPELLAFVARIRVLLGQTLSPPRSGG